MIVYAVFQSAVYRHSCGGIFSTLDASQRCADACAEGDGDDHHSYEVVPFVLDARTATIGRGESAWPPSQWYDEANPVYRAQKGRPAEVDPKDTGYGR